MSLGSILKGIGKGALAVGKVAVNVAGNVVGIGTIIPSNGGSNQATVASINPNVKDGNVMVAPSLWGTLGGSLSNALDGVGNWLNGRTHTQNDVNVGSGGRIDPYSGQTSGLPTWLLPASIIGGLLLLMSGGFKRRRY